MSLKVEVSNRSIKNSFEIVVIVKKDLKAEGVAPCKDLIKLSGFKCEEGEVLTLIEQRKIFISVVDTKDLENYKIAASNAIKKLLKIDNKVAIIGNYDGKDSSVTKALAEGILLGCYKFDKYKSKKSSSKLERVVFRSGKKSTAEVKKAIEEVESVCKYVNFARDLVNSHPDEIYPESFVEVVKKEIKSLPITAKVLDKKALEKENMGSLLAVARASRHEPRVLHLTYKPKGAKKKVVLVGKGLTYDSGGLSLKPGDYMVSMKSDKSGGVAVTGSIMAAAKLGVDVEVHAVVGLVENMIGGDAYKPDDVLVARNGKTIEVKNTDAEGRLVLADCLDYACDLKPDYLFDMATLTGACVVALGDYTTGIMGHNNSLKHKMFSAASKSGELVGALPFNRYLKDMIKSNVADMSNIGSSRYGGAITAGLFLNEFVDEKYKEKWLHLDIAGPAFVDKEWGYNPVGGSGAGVRMMVEFLKDL